MRSRSISIALLMLVVGCGGGAATQQVEEPEAAVATQQEGISEAPMEEEEPIEEELEEEVPSGPVEVTVVIRLGVSDGEGKVSLINDAGETVAEGNSGETFTVESGHYVVNAQITSDRVMVDKPSRTEEVDLMPGATRRVEVRIPMARVRLQPRRGGRALSGGSAVIYRDGTEEEVARFRIGSEHIGISPGRYIADVQSGQHRIRVTGLVFQDGATQNIPVDIQ